MREMAIPWSCRFGIHGWGKWGNEKVVEMVVVQRSAGVVLNERPYRDYIQARQCLSCGLAEERIVAP